MANLILAIVFVALAITSIYLFITSKVTAEERDAMLKDEEMWP